MKIIQSESVLFVDVDETIFMHGDHYSFRRSVVNPYDSGDKIYGCPNLRNIRVMKDRKARGSVVVVWSANGYRWAEAVVKALELEQYVDYVMSKPVGYIDDKQAHEILGERVYLEMK